jgi:hypothetical protein
VGDGARLLSYQVEDLGAGASISARSIFAAPAEGARITKAAIVPQGAAAGVDAGNTVVVALQDQGGNTICTKTYDNVTIPPEDKVYDSLGAIHATHGVLTANEVVTLTVTQGATANMPGFVVVVEWRVP